MDARRHYILLLHVLWSELTLNLTDKQNPRASLAHLFYFQLDPHICDRCIYYSRIRTMWYYKFVNL